MGTNITIDNDSNKAALPTDLSTRKRLVYSRSSP